MSEVTLTIRPERRRGVLLVGRKGGSSSSRRQYRFPNEERARDALARWAADGSARSGVRRRWPNDSAADIRAAVTARLGGGTGAARPTVAMVLEWRMSRAGMAGRMSALVTDPSTHATWSPSLNGPALARRCRGDSSTSSSESLTSSTAEAGHGSSPRERLETAGVRREDPITAEDLEVWREAREEARADRAAAGSPAPR